MSSKAKPRRSSSRSSPFWERAYKGHVLWLGKKKLGKVSLAGGGRYTWSAAGRGGAANDLARARKAVEAAVAMADKQLDLFT
jgi:hypothetical protein